jgi:hypothetical protein
MLSDGAPRGVIRMHKSYNIYNQSDCNHYCKSGKNMCIYIYICIYMYIHMIIPVFAYMYLHILGPAIFKLVVILGIAIDFHVVSGR